MLDQELIIEKIRSLSKNDKAFIGVVMYGSFTRDEGDQYSDVEFCFYIDDLKYNDFNFKKWITQIQTIEACFQNEWGITTVIFDNLIRGEFHISKASEISQIKSWINNVWIEDPEKMILLDRNGEIKKNVSFLIGEGPNRKDVNELELLCYRFTDWMIFGMNVLKRGEIARSLEILWFLHRYLLWMIRILEERTHNFPTPSKAIEKDISVEAYEKYKNCTSSLERESLVKAYSNLWKWGKEMISILVEKYNLAFESGLITKIDLKFGKWFKNTE